MKATLILMILAGYVALAIHGDWLLLFVASGCGVGIMAVFGQIILWGLDWLEAA